MSQTPAAPPNQPLLRTPLYDSHVALGAKMVPFAGWEMPVSYPIGTVAEVNACRSSVGLFDVSHMGEIVVTGPQAAEFLDYATTNSVKSLNAGEAQYSLLLNDQGTVIDDIIVYLLGRNNFLIVVNASRQHEDFARFQKLSSKFDVSVEDSSSEKGLIAVQGPQAISLIQALVVPGSIPLERFAFKDGVNFDFPVIVSRTGYTGEDGVELLCDNSNVDKLWSFILELGAVPCGLGARDVLRLEAGYPLYGHELDENHTPFESGVGWVVKLAKGDFAGRDALIATNAKSSEYKLVGLKTISPVNSIPRQGCMVENTDGVAIGEVTSGTLSPILGCGIALARIKATNAKIGTDLVIDIRGRKVISQVVKTPFVETSLSGAGG